MKPKQKKPCRYCGSQLKTNGNPIKNMQPHERVCKKNPNRVIDTPNEPMDTDEWSAFCQEFYGTRFRSQPIEIQLTDSISIYR